MKNKKLSFFSTKLSVIVITALAFIGCGSSPSAVVLSIADVSIDSIGVSSTDIEAGQSIRFSAEVKNVGLKSANATTIQFYRSTDSMIDTTDTLLTSASVAELASGASIDVRETIFSDLGRFYYGVCVGIVEQRENVSNNCSHGILVNTQLLWQETTGAAGWSARTQHTSLVYDNKMWVLGGFDASYKNDVWYSTDGANWEQATGSAGWSARNGHTSLVYDNKMWVLGGFGGSYKNDVWYSTDGVNWSQAIGSAGWSGRFDHSSLVYDNKMWVLGGNDASYKNDVWYSTDGVNWSQATGDAAWSVRRGHNSLVYDNKMWVLGGFDGGDKNDVWYSRDGMNWVQATGNADWLVRDGHTSLVYDNKMWMIRGFMDRNINYAWYSTDGINWEQTGAVGSRDSIYHSSLVYDNKMWVLGGFISVGGLDSSIRNDVWSTFIHNSRDRGIKLALGEKVSSYLTVDEKEYYSLQLISGSYQIATEGSTDTLCNLYNNSNELLTSNDNGGRGENCSFIFSTNDPVNVYLEVQEASSGASSGDVGAYTLSIIPIAPDVNIRYLGPNIFYEGLDYQLAPQIQNIGISTADNITIKYYFPQNSQISPTDMPDFTSTIASLRAGEVSTATAINISVDNSGDYYGVCLETANEVNLTNNCLFQAIAVPTNPDIAISFSAPNFVYIEDASAAFNPQITFRNQGGLSDPIVFNYYRSSTEILTPDSSNLISSNNISTPVNQFLKNGVTFYRLGGLPNGDTYDASSDITARNSGVFYYGVCLENVRGDETTADNCASQRVIVASSSDIDNNRINSSITQFQANKNRIAAGEKVKFTTTVQNNSASLESDIFIFYFRSSDNIITTGDVVIRRDKLDTLAASTTQDIRLDFTLLDRGYYGACVVNSSSISNCSNAIFIEAIGSTWQQAVGNTGWSARSSHTSLVYDNKIWVIGGFDRLNKNDIWYSRDGINWVQATDDAGWSARSSHGSLVYDNKMWVLAGADNRNRLNDVWYSRDGINWEQATDNAGWAARRSHTSLVYDNKMWVIGGYDGTNRLNDVWYSEDGRNWEQTTGSSTWSARQSPTSLVYDNKMWVIGGYDGTNRLNDVWYSEDGRNWEQTTGNAGWSSRNSHTSLVYDNKMWVLGGFSRIRRNDVWYSTDGINWEQATDNATWSGRNLHSSLVYDNKMWVLGGIDTRDRLNDVWYSVASNDTISTALALSLSSSGNDYSSDAVVVNLQAGDRESYYTFQLTTGNYIIETSSDVGTSCSLYNSERSVVTTDSNSGTKKCSITHTVSNATADFYLQVTGNTSTTTGDYQLLIRKNTTSTGRTSIRIAANTILRSTQKTALISKINPQIQGRLEVKDPITNEHGTVCGDSFGQQDVIVACRELGFSDGYVIPSAQIEQGTGEIMLDDLHCIGDEESLLDCQHNGFRVHNCTHAEDIGIACY